MKEVVLRCPLHQARGSRSLEDALWLRLLLLEGFRVVIVAGGVLSAVGDWCGVLDKYEKIELSLQRYVASQWHHEISCSTFSAASN